MILPLKDENPLVIIPFQLVTILLILANTAVFMVEVFVPEGVGLVVAQLGAVPSDIISGEACWPESCRFPHIFTLITNTFAHAGWGHFLGNMLFLWVFGDNVEDAMGHLGFLAFYLLCGLCASLCHVIFNLESNIPVIGASGAIAGVMGAYLLLHPKVKVLVLVLMRVPLRLSARIVLLLWIGFQFFLLTTDSSGDVAVWAHIGGFAAGMALVPFFKHKQMPLFDRGTPH